MFVPDWAISATFCVVLALVIYIVAHLWWPIKVQDASPPRTPALPPPVSRPYISKIDRLHQNLRLKTGFNEALIARLIWFERERLPNANQEVWMEAAIERWERDNR